MDSNSNFVSESILKASYVVEIGKDAHVPLVVPFGSLESVVKMALSAGMCVSLDVVYNSELYVFKNVVEGVLK